MKTKQIGIWMDHANAHLIEINSDEMENKIIKSLNTDEDKSHVFEKGEKSIHNNENHEQLAYYKTIAAAIMQYQQVLLFGPTNAKTELFNLLKADHHYDKINIAIRQTDKLTENQQHAFVKEYFDSHLPIVE